MTEPQEPQASFVRPLDIQDVMAALVDACGGPKKVGPLLRPDLKDPEAAARWVLDRMNRQRREQFNLGHLEELLRRARALDRHEPKHALDRLAGYHPSQPMTVQEEAEDLQRRFEQSLELMRELQQQQNAIVLRLGEIRGQGTKR